MSSLSSVLFISKYCLNISTIFLRFSGVSGHTRLSMIFGSNFLPVSVVSRTIFSSCLFSSSVVLLSNAGHTKSPNISSASVMSISLIWSSAPMFLFGIILAIATSIRHEFSGAEGVSEESGFSVGILF